MCTCAAQAQHRLLLRPSTCPRLSQGQRPPSAAWFSGMHTLRRMLPCRCTGCCGDASNSCCAFLRPSPCWPTQGLQRCTYLPKVPGCHYGRAMARLRTLNRLSMRLAQAAWLLSFHKPSACAQATLTMNSQLPAPYGLRRMCGHKAPAIAQPPPRGAHSIT